MYVALEYPKWQHQVLVKLKEMCGVNGSPSLPSNKDVLEKLKTIPDVKPYMKKLMPFVAMVKVSTCILGIAQNANKYDVYYLLRRSPLGNTNNDCYAEVSC